MFVEIDHEILSMAVFLPYTDTRRVVVCYKRKHVHQVLVNHLVKLVQEKSVVRRTDHPDMTIAVDWDVKHQTKQTKNQDEHAFYLAFCTSTAALSENVSDSL